MAARTLAYARSNKRTSIKTQRRTKAIARLYKSVTPSNNFAFASSRKNTGFPDAIRTTLRYFDHRVQLNPAANTTAVHIFRLNRYFGVRAPRSRWFILIVVCLPVI